MIKIDILIPFIEGPDDSLELRYTLRSIEKYLQVDPVIWILGECPNWLTNVNVIKLERKGGNFKKFKDQLNKIHHFINLKNIGDEFIYMYDDQFFINPVTIDEIKKPRAYYNFKKIDITQFLNTHQTAGKNWKDLFEKTILKLKEQNKPLFGYETHMPRCFEVNKVKEIFKKYNCLEEPYQFSTLYYNNYCTNPEILTRYNFFKFGLYEELSSNAIIRKSQRYKVLNLLPEIYELKQTKEALHQLFPTPSKYENNEQKCEQKPIIEKPGRNLPGIVEEKKDTKLREDWPFLEKPECPEELKILVAEKITAYHNYVNAHKKLFDCTSNEEQFKTAREVIENFTENRLIQRELEYYKKQNKVLGLHPKFKYLADMRKLRSMNVIELFQKKQKLEHNIWRIKSEVEKNDKPHLYHERVKSLKDKQAEIAEIDRLLNG